MAFKGYSNNVTTAALNTPTKTRFLILVVTIHVPHDYTNLSPSLSFRTSTNLVLPFVASCLIQLFPS